MVSNRRSSYRREVIEKTLREFTESEKQALADVIAYAADEDKTEQFFYTTGINCSVEFARDQFNATKIRFGKTGGNVAYHAYQSFREGEVTPDEAHAIGVQLARELWGDRFQIVVATHVNTKCTHNHIVINSVSFKDGLKFHDCKDTYRQLKENSMTAKTLTDSLRRHPTGYVSNAVCLSLKTPKAKA